jgi:hypothetical protein
MNKYKIGDKVKVLNFGNNDYSTVSDMEEYIGSIGTVTRVDTQMGGIIGYRIDTDGSNWWWDERILDKVDTSYPKHFTPIAGYIM